eukprot:CAMPEP_0116914174 /NCGR_PEP_ID=MMETSP0467-20121206/17169_1 /TAXON_ID=283647 /ORGANISM="Mesodinium pulex, Strain SPMC105" /LENGTH=76 /DNA_ID=CAMNT_0004590583 /DNA_START=465 /DNA_END=695 /DNA_ORIENTATION=-
MHKWTGEVPHWSFQYFFDLIVNSIRFSIVRGVESAYYTLSKTELANKLFLNNTQELKKFLNDDFNLRNKEWVDHEH